MGLAAISLCLLSWWLGRPFADEPSKTNAPKSILMRALWPWIDAVAQFCRPLMSWHVRRRLEVLLRQAGVTEPWSPAHLFALQCIGASAASVAIFFLVRDTDSFLVSTACTLFAGLATAALPVQRLRGRIRRRKLQMLREFPFLLDMVTLSVEAGLNLHGAMRQMAQNGPPGPLRDELRHMLSDVRTGASRHEALAQWAVRCDLPAVHYFVAAVGQAEQSGMSLGSVLRAQADQRRSERFQRAEKLALEAPVKLLFPLVTCIFPCSFLIIAFPIAGKFLALIEP